jgi:dihydrofolate synthase/folylpolyglutamate synthase
VGNNVTPEIKSPPLTLAQWLVKIQQLHPQEIDLGLERVKSVADRLLVNKPAPVVITVAGTNGKGSTAAYCASLLQESGLKVGLFTSPHIFDFSERIRVNGCPITPKYVIEVL